MPFVANIDDNIAKSNRKPQNMVSLQPGQAHDLLHNSAESGGQPLLA
jgi:hypothetical protein